MQKTEIGMNSSTHTTPGFNQLAVGLESAITDFKETTSTGMLAKVSSYVRSHPVQVAAAVGAVAAVGVMFATFWRPTTAPKVSGERNY